MTHQKPVVLLVDDDPAALEMLNQALETESLATVCVGDAEAALPVLEQGGVRVVVTDKNLPGMSGVDLIREIRTRRLNVGVLLVTGYGSKDSALTGLNLAIDGYLQKPFDDIFAVVARVEELARRREWDLVSVNAVPVPCSQRGLRILVANADPEDAEWLRKHLDAPEDTVVFASQSDIVLDQLRKQPFDLLVVDTNVEPSGIFGLIEKASAIAVGTICVVTAEAPELDTLIRLIDLRVRAVVEKPFSQIGFAQTVGPVIDTLRHQCSFHSE